MKKSQSQTKKLKIGQVSLEFLTTYGWAFLVAIIVLAAFGYFGVLSPGKFTGKKCMLGRQLKCDAFMLGIDATNKPVVKLRVVNLQSSRIVVQNIAFTNRESTPLTGCTLTAPALPITIMEGEGADFTSTCTADTGNFFDGDKNKAEISLTYYLAKSGPSYNTTVSGEIYDQVQKV